MKFKSEIVARIETERTIVHGNRELIRLYEEKVKKVIEMVEMDETRPYGFRPLIITVPSRSVFHLRQVICQSRKPLGFVHEMKHFEEK